MRVKDAATLLGLQPNTISKLARSGELRSLGYGRVCADSVNHYLLNRKRIAKIIEKPKFEGLTYQEAAISLGLPVTTIRKYVAIGRIKATNRRILREDLEDARKLSLKAKRAKVDKMDYGTTIIWNRLKPKLVIVRINKRLENIFTKVKQ